MGQPTKKQIALENLEKNAKNRICRVYGRKSGTGFFCIISLNENENRKVLITSRIIIDKEDIAKRTLQILLKNNEIKKIDLDNRIKYTNRRVTIIEIKDSDGISSESFFEIDPEIFKGYTKLINQNLYSIVLDDGLCVSEGKFLDLQNNNNEFFHTCSTRDGSLGGPLINALNNRVIGINGINRGIKNKNVGICLKESIEEFKKIVLLQYKNNTNVFTPQRINSLDDFRKNYEIKQKILANKFYSIFSAYSIDDRKLVMVKEFNNETCEKIYDYINEEISALSKIRNKFIMKIKEYYLSKNKSIIIYNDFYVILKNIKTKLTLEEIQKFLIQINEALKELKKQNINDIILSPENICIHNNNYKLINLFPFYKALKKEQIELDTNSEKYINLNLSDFDQKLLCNLGTLIYEMYFQEFPLEFSKQKIKHSESKNFDILIENLLQINKNKFTWNDYINNNFLESIPLRKKFMFLYEENIDELTTGINLEFNQVSEENLVLLSKIELNNLYWLNLSDNKIENLEFFGQGLKNLKILILEFNNIKSLNFKEIQPYIENLENLYIGSNSIESITFISGINFSSLTCLSLYNNKINDLSPLKNSHIPFLETLNLSFNEIVDISPICNEGFNNLITIYLNNNQIQNINYLENSFPILEVLNMENNSIFDINVLDKVKFINNIKELYLNNNPIAKFEKLHLCYFPSIKKITLCKNTKENQNLSLLTIKLKLFGYEIDEEDSKNINKNEIIMNPNEKISVLFIPDYCSHNIYKYINDLENINNIFKIIANSNVTKEELEKYFIDEILDISNEKSELFKKDIEKTQKYNNYSIIFYNENKLVNQKLKTNLINLVEDYHNYHEIKDKYNKIPGCLGMANENLFNRINCPLSILNGNYYKNIPRDIIVDKNHKLSEILKQSDYYQRLPLLFIKNQYYKQFIQFLDYYNKYKHYEKYKDIFKKYFIIPYDKSNNYLHNHKDSIFAEIIENINYIYYTREQVEKIIMKIKKQFINYKKLIKDWIINIFDIMADYILLVLNKSANYRICQECKNPLLFIEEIKREINSKNLNYNDIDKDPFFYKSFKITNKILDYIIQNNDIDFSSINSFEDKIKGKVSHIVANPPKIDRFINLIYFNDNPYNSIKSEIEKFKNETNGLFIFCNSLESFEDVIQMISSDNKNNCDFCLISNGKSFLDIMNYIKDIKEKENKKFEFKKICIFCFNKENYLSYLNQYNNLEGIYTTEEEVIQFIENNSYNETKVYKSLKIMTFENYSKKYYKIHHIISKYYREDPGDNFSKFYNIIKEEFQNNNELLKTFKKFEIQTNSQNATELIKDYTEEGNECLYKVFNTKWLLNFEKWSLDKKVSKGWLDRIKNFLAKLNFFNRKKNVINEYLYSEKKAYFIGQFMFKVNFKIIEEMNNHNKFYNKKELKLYRGMILDNIETLSYPIELGKIITFPTFISTSQDENIAKIRFAKIEDIDMKKQEHKYSIIFNITIKQNMDFFPLYFKISETYYKDEEEFLFNPFTFFKIQDYKFDYSNKNLFLELEAIGRKEILELHLDERHKLIYNEEKNIVEYEQYIGDRKNGLKNGRGTLYYRNNQIKYVGDFVNDKFEGQGRYNWEDCEYYIGQFINGLKNGKGTIYYEDNSIKYKGDFVNDKYEGQGKYIWKNGYYYIGPYLNGKRKGRGTLYDRNGSVKYEGDFSNDNYEGQGKYVWENGDYYIGQFLNGKCHGSGKKYKKNNFLIYDGNYFNGKKHGHGKYYLENGNYYDGEWLNDNRHGKGILYDNNNTIIMECNFENGNLIENEDDCSLF